MDKPKLWTRDFCIVTVENFFAYFAYYLLMATITLYATEQFHASPSLAGLASSIFIIGTLIGRLFGGRSIERVGRKKILYIGFIFFLITSFMYFVVNSLALLILVRILHGAAFGLTTTATGTIVTSIIPSERRGEGIGFYALSTTVAAAIGPFLGMFITQHAKFNMNFVLCMVILTVSFLISFILQVPRVELTNEELKKLKQYKLSSFFEVKAIPISTVSVFIGLAYSSILSFLTSYSREINLADAASFFFVTYAGAILVSRPFTGRWFDRKGENIVMYPTFLLFAVGLLLLSQAHHGLILLLAGVFVGFGYGNFLSNAQAISVKVSPKQRMALATSTFFVFTDVGIGIGPFILGYFIPLFGFRALYLCMAMVVLACIIFYYFLHGRQASQGKAMINLAK